VRIKLDRTVNCIDGVQLLRTETSLGRCVRRKPTHQQPQYTLLLQVFFKIHIVTDLDFTEARDSEWQWHQLGNMQVCTSLQTDNHASTPPLSFYRPDALPAAKPTASKH